jgi:hypothetical protein
MLRTVRQGDRSAFLPAGGTVNTPIRTYGECPDTEATAFALLALLESGQAPDLAVRMSEYLMGRRSEGFAWGSTWTTACVLMALLELTGKLSAEHRLEKILIRCGSEVLLENEDLALDAVRTRRVKVQGEAGVRVLLSSGSPGTPYVCTFSGRVSQEAYEKSRPTPPFGVKTVWARSRLRRSEGAILKVVVLSERPMTFPLLSVGLPPGADVSRARLEDMVKRKAVRRYEVRRGEVVFYLDDLPGRRLLELYVRFRPTLRGTFRVKPAKLTEYYRPDRPAFSAEKTLIVE